MAGRGTAGRVMVGRGRAGRDNYGSSSENKYATKQQIGRVRQRDFDAAEADDWFCYSALCDVFHLNYEEVKCC